MWPLGMAAGLVVVGWMLQASRPVGHDLAWLLIATGRWLDGADVYGRDLVEWNPPANLLVWMPAVGWARVADGSVVASARVEVFVVGLLSMALAGSILFAATSRAERRGVSLFGLAIAFAYFVLPGDAFGQREHWVAMLSLPELLLVACVVLGRPVPTRTAVAAGTALGLAICMKPQYGLLFIALESWVALRLRSMGAWRRPDVFALLCCGLGYLTFVAVLTPDYLNQIVPMARDTYWVYQAKLVRILDWREWTLLPVGLVLALSIRGNRLLFEIAAVFAGATFAFYGVALLQQTGWPYHFLPVEVAFGGLVGLCAWRVAGLGWPSFASSRVRLADRAGAGLGFCAVLVLVLLAPTPWAELYEKGAPWREGALTGQIAVLARGLDEHASGGPVFVVSPSLVGVAPAMLYGDLEWSGRLPGFYLPAAISRQRRGDPEVPSRLDARRADGLEGWLRDAVIEDLTRRPPELFLIDRVERRKVFAGVPFDLLAYLREDPRFEAIWARYEIVARVGRFDLARPVANRSPTRSPSP